jgi:hypothetical protein
MSEPALQSLWINPAQAGRNLNATVVPWCKDRMAEGKQVVASFEVAQDIRSLQQNAFMWAFVLKNISQQAQLEGIGATADGWHLYYKRMFLGYQLKKVKVPGKKRPSITRELRSTTKLSVPKMSKYMEQVMAHAATTFGVAFEDGKRWEDWKP